MTDGKRVELQISLIEGATPEEQAIIDALLERFQVASAELAMGPEGLVRAALVFGACMNLVMGLFAQAPMPSQASILLKTLELFQKNGADIHWLGIANAPTLDGMDTSSTKH